MPAFCNDCLVKYAWARVVLEIVQGIFASLPETRNNLQMLIDLYKSNVLKTDKSQIRFCFAKSSRLAKISCGYAIISFSSTKIVKYFVLLCKVPLVFLSVAG
jgi:hypothetical protein